MKNLFFFQIEEIYQPAKNKIFEEIEKRNLFFSYFSVGSGYYMLVFGKQNFERDFLYKSLRIIREINSHKRRLRSFRGFFIYILSLLDLENNKNTKFLKSNLKPYFWSDLASVIRQNKNSKLLKFLFGNDGLNGETKINSLEKRIILLETELKILKQKERLKT